MAGPFAGRTFASNTVRKRDHPVRKEANIQERLPFYGTKKPAQKLHKLGGKRVVPPESFHVEKCEGSLPDGKIERARA